MKTTRSEKLYQQALQLMPGGVNSPVRAFKSVGMDPLIMKRGSGCRIYDEDDNEFIDYVGSWGPLILGHCNPAVVEAIAAAAKNGSSFGATCAREIELAEMICEAFPSIDKVRMVNSGTEATMSAIRLARAYTGRNKIIKFEGCYHGHADAFLVKAGSGMLTTGSQSSPGIPRSITEHTLLCKYNDIESVKKAFMQFGPDIAAVIIEPVAGNMGLIPAEIEFLTAVREITSMYGSILIFDEVITGFRLCYGGVQNITGIIPDLTTLGKIIGGGLPVGAYGGRREIMDRVAPQGEVYQAGTLAGNPLAMTAGIATLKQLKDGELYDRLEVLGYLLAGKIRTLFEAHDLYYTIKRLGSMFCIFFTEEEVYDYESVQSCNTGQYATFYRNLLNCGVYLPPSQFEVSFISSAHDLKDIDITLEAMGKALDMMK
ncbi:MAG: glutamate-1-semialdehyde 2,1-aminomutase [Syntrophomonadaceae bacterium]|nr:glutamate-1-semialdehyde 2,1-aminomutase [Syntrophomonadaceae bacterium]